MPAGTISEPIVRTVDNRIVIFYHPVYAHIAHIGDDLISFYQKPAGSLKHEFLIGAAFILPASIKVIPVEQALRGLLLCPAF